MMESLLKKWKEIVGSAIFLGGIVWVGITSADEIIKNIKEVPTLKEAVEQNASQIKALLDKKDANEQTILDQNERILRMLEDMSNTEPVRRD